MKNLFTILAIVLLSLTASAQIETTTDEMTGRTTITVTEYLEMEQEGKGFVLAPRIEHPSGQMDYLAGIMSGFSGCFERDKMIILFKDGSNLNLHSIAKFNCKGLVVFNINNKIRNQLFEKEIDKIRISSKRSYESITVEVDNPRYFIEIGEAINEI